MKSVSNDIWVKAGGLANDVRMHACVYMHVPHAPGLNVLGNIILLQNISLAKTVKSQEAKKPKRGAYQNH